MILGDAIKRILFNPFYIYSVTVTSSLLFYFLGWSIYPDLSSNVLALFGSTALLSFFIGFRIPSLKKPTSHGKEYNRLWRFSIYSLVLLICGFVWIFVKCGIPFYNIFFSIDKYHHRDFEGIAYLSTISMYGLSSLICIWLNAALVLKQKKYFLLVAIALLPVILMASRGYAMLIIFPSALIFLFYTKLSNTRVVSLLFIIVSLLYVFGLFGDYREKAKTRDGDNSFYDDFKSDSYPSFLPDEFFWGYFYFSSPLAKLEYTVQDSAINNLDIDYAAFSVFELMPYSFSSRLKNIFHLEERISEHIYPPWFVGTTYYGPYLYAKWVGVVIFGIWLLIVVYFLTIISQRYLGIWGLPVLANLSLYMLLSIFDNMVAFAPINFQLLGCLLVGVLMYKEEKRILTNIGSPKK